MKTLCQSFPARCAFARFFRETAPRFTEEPLHTVQCVSLGVRIARHTALGWDNAAVPDDVADVAQLLNLSTSAAMSLLRSLEI